MTGARQGTYWMGTIPYDNDMDMDLLFQLNVDCIKWMRGQQEIGEGGFHHWQVLLNVAPKKSLRQMKDIHPRAHWELSRSTAAEAYVWKEISRVPETQFEYGVKPFKRNSKVDWDNVWALCIKNDLDFIDPGIKIRHWNALTSIRNAHVLPIRRPDVQVDYYWGRTGTGKSFSADTKYPDAYWKISSNKWWDGYSGEDTVIIDELSTECISIPKLLTWFDRYKCSVEVKGGTIGLRATKFIITSNLSLDELLVNEKEVHKAAFRRRVKATEFLNPFI